MDAGLEFPAAYLHNHRAVPPHVLYPWMQISIDEVGCPHSVSDVRLRLGVIHKSTHSSIILSGIQAACGKEGGQVTYWLE